MKIIYLHGYQGSSQSDKAFFLKEWFGEAQVIAPDIRYEKPCIFQSCLELENIIEVLQSAGEKIFVIGSSFGGYMGFHLFKRFKNRTLLINPALNYRVLLEHTGIDTSDIENHTQGYPLANSLDVWIANDDELLGKPFFDNLRKEYPLFHYEYFDHAGHRFSVFKNYSKEIKELIGIDLK